jgi:hypothetical protein
MARPRNFGLDPHPLRQINLLASETAEKIHALEDDLIKILHEMDQKRIYVRFGHKSLRGYCVNGLGFSRTQSQRIVTRIRRLETTVKIGQ